MMASKRYLSGWMAIGLAAIALAGAPGSASAQSVTGGIRVGASASSLVNEDSDDSTRRLGVNPGVFVDFNLNPRVAIRLEGAFAMKGSKGEGSGGDYTVALDYAEAPILLKLKPSAGQPVVVMAGVAPSRKVGAKYKADGDTTKYGDLVHSFDLGLVVGVGFGPVDVRYTRGTKPVFNFNDPEDSDSDDKNQTISVGVSIPLFGKRRP